MWAVVVFGVGIGVGVAVVIIYVYKLEPIFVVAWLDP